MKSIEFTRKDNGFNVAIRDNEKTQVIGVATRLESLVDGAPLGILYIHLSPECVPLYKSNDGREFKVQIMKHIFVQPEDELSFAWGKGYIKS